jgi:hypothetical protein
MQWYWILAIMILIIVIYFYYPTTIAVDEYGSKMIQCTVGGINIKSAQWSSGGCSGDVTAKLAKCNGQSICNIPVNTGQLGDPCPGKDKTLTMQYNCSRW